jgi:hypothetical protein
MEERRSAYRILVGKPEGKKQLARPRCRWEYTTRWIFRKLDEGQGLDLAWDRDRWWAVTNAVMNLHFP